jgi:hypothetical protein
MKITYLLISHLQTLSVEGIYSWGLDSLSAPMGTYRTLKALVVSGLVLDKCMGMCLSVVSRYTCRKQVVL